MCMPRQVITELGSRDTGFDKVHSCNIVVAVTDNVNLGKNLEVIELITLYDAPFRFMNKEKTFV